MSQTGCPDIFWFLNFGLPGILNFLGTCSISQIWSSVFLQTGWVYFSPPALISFVSLSVCLFGVTCLEVAAQFVHGTSIKHSQLLSDKPDTDRSNASHAAEQTNVNFMQIPASWCFHRELCTFAGSYASSMSSKLLVINFFVGKGWMPCCRYVDKTHTY